MDHGTSKSTDDFFNFELRVVCGEVSTSPCTTTGRRLATSNPSSEQLRIEFHFDGVQVAFGLDTRSQEKRKTKDQMTNAECIREAV